MQSNSLRLNITQDYVEGIFQQYLLSCIIVSVYSHEVISTESERKSLKKKRISSIDGCTRVNT